MTIYCNKIVILNSYNTETYYTQTEEEVYSKFDNWIRDNHFDKWSIHQREEFKNNQIKEIIATECDNCMYDIRLIYYSDDTKSMLVHGSNLIMYY